MSTIAVPLEPVEYSWAESASPHMREQGRSVLVPVGVRRRREEVGLAGAAERMRTVASMVWFGWLIAIGLIVGGTALVVALRMAATIWAVSL